MTSVAQSIQLTVPEGQTLDLAHSFGCGQIFRWREVNGAWVGAIGQTAVSIVLEAGALGVRAEGPGLSEEELRSFLGLDVDLGDVTRQIATDEVMARAVAALPGLRLLRQEPWECLVSFIASAWNNVPKIERSTELLARRWGTTRPVEAPAGAVSVACFPSPEVLAGRSDAELRDCGLGYRAPLILATARRVAEGAIDLPTLRPLPYDTALEALLRLPGVGRKVADCILLFSLEKGEAFPVDVWVRRLVHEHYRRDVARFVELPPDGTTTGPSDREYRGIHAFARNRWGRWAGYAQQYLFHARRLGVI